VDSTWAENRDQKQLSAKEDATGSSRDDSRLSLQKSPVRQRGDGSSAAYKEDRFLALRIPHRGSVGIVQFQPTTRVDGLVVAV
jgi:hypothetical protein